MISTVVCDTCYVGCNIILLVELVICRYDVREPSITSHKQITLLSVPIMSHVTYKSTGYERFIHYLGQNVSTTDPGIFKTVGIS